MDCHCFCVNISEVSVGRSTVGGSPCARVVHRREAGDVGTVLHRIISSIVQSGGFRVGQSSMKGVLGDLVLKCNKSALQFDLPS
jgi:hypothetical protein